MARLFLFLVGINGLLAVALGAHGAHGLKDAVSEHMLITFQKGVYYQGLHTLALFGVVLLLMHFPASRWLKLSGWSFVAGIILFSGSLYLIVFSGIRSLGIITPVGGVAFLLGWLCLAIAAYRDLQTKAD